MFKHQSYNDFIYAKNMSLRNSVFDMVFKPFSIQRVHLHVHIRDIIINGEHIKCTALLVMVLIYEVILGTIHTG